MDKITKINGPIFKISKITKKNRNKSHPSKNIRKNIKVNRNEKINKKNISNINEDKKGKQIMPISYLSFPVVKNEEESGYYYLLKKDDVNCKKDIPIKSKISQVYHNEESKEKKERRKDDTLSDVGINDNEEINLIIISEKKIFQVLIKSIMI